MNKLYIGLAVIAVQVAAIWLAYSEGKQAGAVETVLAYQKADAEGATDVRKTAKELLSDLGGVSDPIGLLCSTAGLRDAECDNE